MTSTTRNTTAKPAKKTAATKTTARKTAARKRTTKPTPTVNLRKPLQIREPAPTDEFLTEAQTRAAYTLALAGLSLSIRAWRDNGDGSATFPFHSGARITYTPNTVPALTAHTPCARGAHHTDPITTVADLHAASHRARHCRTLHGHTTWPDMVHLQLPAATGHPHSIPTRNDVTQTIRLRLPADTEQPKEHAA